MVGSTAALLADWWASTLVAMKADLMELSSAVQTDIAQVAESVEKWDVWKADSMGLSEVVMTVVYSVTYLVYLMVSLMAVKTDKVKDDWSVL